MNIVNPLILLHVVIKTTILAHPKTTPQKFGPSVDSGDGFRLQMVIAMTTMHPSFRMIDGHIW